MQETPTTSNIATTTETAPAPKTKLEEKQALLKELEESKVFYDKEVKKWQSKREGAQEMMEMMFPKGKVGFGTSSVKEKGDKYIVWVERSLDQDSERLSEINQRLKDLKYTV